ncbi:hypothetical protein PV04_08702 [Phialophora macrospora]|uniref:G-protein coupled receptors family 1 profile domain-containing protein n=1 Tax=Phialophora macrospora TaxID=1851006 RepID=A0A0D2FUG8_9EURO|nr:hypothetical protein PV04_08702 [Phialophora macrospora]
MVSQYTSSSQPTTTSSLHTWAWRDTITGPTGVGKAAPAPLSTSQSRAVLITALSCACVSLVLVLLTLRWFLMMHRCFRHSLVLHLVASDTLKAVWYFVFPVVVLVGGPVGSTSNFCQASGFLLAFAIEASDMAILLIALHSTLSIIRSDHTIGKGGLYRCRNWIYPMWLGPPLLAASLAFINKEEGYTLAGSFCYLPKRPFWYRLALSWVPRYLIISLILIMYIWIYIYVYVKFRGFENLGAIDSTDETEMERRSGLCMKSNDVEQKGTDRIGWSIQSPVQSPSHWQPQYRIPGVRASLPCKPLQPWDHVNFITSRPLQVPIAEVLEDNEVENMMARGRGWSGDTQVAATDGAGHLALTQERDSKREGDPNKPPRGPAPYGVTDATPDDGRTKSLKAPDRPIDPLRKTRLAIRRQLRYLFIYPLVYTIMWSFPFAAHALNYNDYYVQHPIFWLSLVQTVMLSLQAGVDSIMFSCSEKPWRRVDASSKFSMPFLRRQSKALLRRCSFEKPSASTSDHLARQQPVANHIPTWWEAEGRRRNDSVWLGTDTTSHTLSPLTTRTRSRSPHHQRPNLYPRARSSEPGTAFGLELAPTARLSGNYVPDETGTGTLP